MKYMSLQEIAAACGGTYYGGSEFLPWATGKAAVPLQKGRAHL